jgi:hypothetical protein
MTSVAALALTALIFQPLSAQGAPWTALDNKGVTHPPGGFVGAAQDVVFTPDNAPHNTCPPFGPCPPGNRTTTEYLAFGVDFTVFGGNPPLGIFSDPPDKFGGVNAAGDLDLITDSCGRIVIPNSQAQATTDLVMIEAGFVGGPGDILLEVYNVGGAVIGSSIADDGIGPDGDLVARVQLGSATIASFCVITPTNDTYGLRRIHLNSPQATPVEPSSWGMLKAVYR